MEIQKDISEKIMMDKVNKTFTVLVEEYNGNNNYTGRSYMDSPDIDGLVFFDSEKKLEIGAFVKVKIIDYLEYDLIGEVINESSK